MTSQTFQSFSRALPEPHLLVTSSGTVVSANPAAMRLFGLSPAADYQIPLHDLVSEDPERVDAMLRLCASSGSMVPCSATLRLNGERQRFHGCAVTSEPGRRTDLLLLRFEPIEKAATRFVALNRSIDELTKESRERRKAQEALRTAVQRLEFLADASEVLASSLDYEQTLRNAARLAVPRLADWCAVDVLEPDAGLVRVAVEHSDPEKVRLAYELAARYPADPDRPRGAPLVMRTGEPDLIPTIKDELLVSVAKDADHLALLRKLSLSSYLVAPLKTATQVLGVITFVYAESERTYTEDDVLWAEDIGRRAATAIENARLVAAIEHARDQISEQAQELELQAEELQAQAVQLSNQAVELEQQLEEAAQTRAEAERANQAKSQFLAVMSHELRTPLNAVVGYTDLLDAEVAGPVNERQREQLDRVRASARHLIGLIDQVLSLARIEAGREDLRLQPVDLLDIVSQTVSIMEPLAERRGIEIRTRLPDHMPPVVTDEGKLRQILLNLIGNGVKFTDHGHVELELLHERDRVTIIVRDTGVGIPQNLLSVIFEPFTQVDQRLSRRTEGSGLGLAVSRELALLLGGDLHAQSTLGEGSSFSLSLPVRYGGEESM